MVHISEIEAQLSRLGVRKTKWCAAEIRELQHILLDDEEIIGCVKGRYFGGFAILVATPKRLLLIDKKVMYTGVEDIRYDMISEVSYNTRFLDASVNIFTVNKQHRFTSMNKPHLRALTSYMQRRVMEMRQYQHQDSVTPMGKALASYQPTPLRNRTHVPRYLSHAMGSVATTLARRYHNPNPYTRGSFRVTTGDIGFTG